MNEGVYMVLHRLALFFVFSYVSGLLLSDTNWNKFVAAFSIRNILVHLKNAN